MIVVTERTSEELLSTRTVIVPSRTGCNPGNKGLGIESYLSFIFIRHSQLIEYQEQLGL